MPTVFVTNRGCHDFTDALRFGSLTFCTEGILPKYSTSQMVRELTASMRDSTPADYILLTSLTTLCSIACAMFAARHGCLNLLIHEREGYIERKIIIPRTT